MADDLISRQVAIDAMENVDWYHINKDGRLIHGANSEEDEPLYKAEDIYNVLEQLPSAEPNLFNNNILRHPQCTSRTKLGNCDPVGGFCTSVPKEMCDAQEHEKYIDADLISRQAVIEINRSYHGQMPNEVNHRIWKEINELPSAQPELIEREAYIRGFEQGKTQGRLDTLSAQPEIVRCKDCEYGEQDEYGRWYCRGFGCQVGDEDGNGFCSDAERKKYV